MKNQDQAYLNYMGRVVYNFWDQDYIPKSAEQAKPDGKTLFPINEAVQTFLVNNEINLFRKGHNNLYGQVNRSFTHNSLDIGDGITLKRLVDKSIVSEIDIIGIKNICQSTYTNSFLFPRFASNIENHYFSKNGLHIAHVGSLSSYSQIDFTCFDSMNNEQIKYVLNDGLVGQKFVVNNDMSLKLSQMISLFLCETSRDPASFFTIPMCLELGEMLFNLFTEKKLGDFRAAFKSIHESIFFRKIIGQKDKLDEDIKNLDKELFQDEISKKEKDFAKIIVDIDSKFIDIDNLIDIPKSKIIKDIILNLFPLSMEKAVPASRYISNKINEELKEYNDLYHCYDHDKGSINDAKNLLVVEQQLINIYKEYVFLRQPKNEVLQNKDTNFSMYEKLSNEWFNMCFEEDTFNIKCVGLVDNALSPLFEV